MGAAAAGGLFRPYLPTCYRSRRAAWPGGKPSLGAAELQVGFSDLIHLPVLSIPQSGLVGQARR